MVPTVVWRAFSEQLLCRTFPTDLIFSRVLLPVPWNGTTRESERQGGSSPPHPPFAPVHTWPNLCILRWPLLSSFKHTKAPCFRVSESFSPSRLFLQFLARFRGCQLLCTPYKSTCPRLSIHSVLSPPPSAQEYARSSRNAYLLSTCSAVLQSNLSVGLHRSHRSKKLIAQGSVEATTTRTTAAACRQYIHAIQSNKRLTTRQALDKKKNLYISCARPLHVAFVGIL